MYKNFEKYVPSEPFYKKLHDEHDITFMKDDQGRDWYDIQKELDLNLLTIFCNSDGILMHVDSNPSAIPPVQGGFCFQIDALPIELNASSNIHYNLDTGEFKYVTPETSLNALLRELKLLEIRLEMGDAVEDEIAEVKGKIFRKVKGQR